ncbi:uncharacterized protein K02A2.6-like [Wyeomyia smithii]|uniref:uncharacterized protein K02A2.6-like n=1 Tax=Wyeomyia smithii TaxID=174621 RepID=UPI002467B74E|nr:uncharacterized protein K02A2.6-like [Wyeomyia smithii]
MSTISCRGCLQLVKSEAEDIISYGGKVNRACEDFDFNNVKIDQFKCLVFVCGMKAHCYADIRAKLLSRIEGETVEAPVSLQNLIDDYQRLVNLKADTSLIERQSSSKPTVHAVQEKQVKFRQQQSSKSDNKLPRTPCWQCGQMHYVRDCTFSNHLCKQCNCIGHKEGYYGCFSKPKPTQVQGEKKKKSHKSSKAESRVIYIVNHIAQHSSKRKFVPTFINGIATKLQLDTASDITVISERTWNILGKPEIKNTMVEAINASGKPLKLIGEFQCEVSINAKTCQGRCFVTTAPNLNLMGIDWIEQFGLWSIPIDSICNQLQTKTVDKQISDFRAKHADVFNGTLGHCKKIKVKLFLKSNAKPIFCPKRPVPFNTIPLVNAELTRLQSLGIIEPVDFSEWAAPIVAVRKPNGKVRICADYSTGLNDALEPNHYPLPTPEEIFAQLNGSTIFSVVDLSDAYLQLEVDDESKKLLTINTHRGLFRFNRLAPGVKSAPGAFQRLVDGMIANILGVRSFQLPERFKPYWMMKP